MEPLTGYFAASIDGGYVAVINISNFRPGQVFLQADDSNQLESLIGIALALHFHEWVYSGCWSFVKLSQLGALEVGISQANAFEAHQQLLRITAERGSIFNDGRFVTFSIQGVNFTMPHQDRSSKLIQQVRPTPVRFTEEMRCGFSDYKAGVMSRRSKARC